MKLAPVFVLLGLAASVVAWAQEKSAPVRVTLVRWPYT